MINTTEELQLLLNNYCLILRKYNLYSKEIFYTKFAEVDKQILDKAWEFSFKKIQNIEIIKNSSDISKNDEIIINGYVDNFEREYVDFFYFLNKPYDITVLNLAVENRDRRFRHIIAMKYSDVAENKIFQLVQVLEELKNKQLKIKVFFDKLKGIAILSIFPFLFITVFFGSRIRDGFTSVDILTERIYEREVYKFNGSICRDGTTSRSQGRGTCSWHKGVSYKFYKGQHKKTMEECKIIAKDRSWIE